MKYKADVTLCTATRISVVVSSVQSVSAELTLLHARAAARALCALSKYAQATADLKSVARAHENVFEAADRHQQDCLQKMKASARRLLAIEERIRREAV